MQLQFLYRNALIIILSIPTMVFSATPPAPQAASVTPTITIAQTASVPIATMQAIPAIGALARRQSAPDIHTDAKHFQENHKSQPQTPTTHPQSAPMQIKPRPSRSQSMNTREGILSSSFPSPKALVYTYNSPPRHSPTLRPVGTNPQSPANLVLAPNDSPKTTNRKTYNLLISGLSPSINSLAASIIKAREEISAMHKKTPFLDDNEIANLSKLSALIEQSKACLKSLVSQRNSKNQGE